MEVINCRNVNDGFIKALDKIEMDHIVLESRAGEVMEFPTPVTTVYKNPTERVLFEELRDANPFFHFMESLWMLAGRNDLAYVEQYNKRMREYSDDGVELHGAYGYRWINVRGQLIKDLRNCVRAVSIIASHCHRLHPATPSGSRIETPQQYAFVYRKK